MTLDVQASRLSSSEKVIVSTPVTLLSSDESKVGGVLSWTCANACPGTCCHSGTDGATIQAPVGGVPAPPYCRNATATAARTSSVAVSTNADRAFFCGRRRRAAPGNPLAECRKMASQLRLRRQVRRKKCRCGAQKAKNRPVLPPAGYLIGKKTRFCRIRHKYLIVLNRNIAS